MLAERLRLNTQRLVAVRLPEYALASMWWPLRLYVPDDNAEKVITIWLNSTLGIINMLSYRVPTEGPWVKFKKPMLEQINVLDSHRLTTGQIERLVNTYDLVASNELLPLSHMMEDASRQIIDDVIAEILELPRLDSLRQSLAQEPVICGRPL